jgi:hypothetical protein
LALVFELLHLDTVGVFREFTPIGVALVHPGIIHTEGAFILTIVEESAVLGSVVHTIALIVHDLYFCNAVRTGIRTVIDIIAMKTVDSGDARLLVT